jgi:uncharacterized Fe-S cluster-containing MiaB family protein
MTDEIVTYLLVKPAFITDKESINDIIHSIHFLRLLSETYGIQITPKLEPAAIVDGTILSLLHMDNNTPYHYEPLSYWQSLRYWQDLRLMMIFTQF